MPWTNGSGSTTSSYCCTCPFQTLPVHFLLSSFIRCSSAAADSASTSMTVCFSPSSSLAYISANSDNPLDTTPVIICVALSTTDPAVSTMAVSRSLACPRPEPPAPTACSLMPEPRAPPGCCGARTKHSSIARMPLSSSALATNTLCLGAPGPARLFPFGCPLPRPPGPGMSECCC